MNNTEITLEAALKNIEIVIFEQFNGTRQQHIALEQSLNKIKEELAKEKCNCSEQTKCMKSDS